MAAIASMGSVVSIRYQGGVKGEEPVDDRGTGEPLVVMVGDMKLPRGIEQALVGMEEGESKTVEVPPELGYGSYQEELAQWYPKTMIDDGYSLKKGDVVFWNNRQVGIKQPAFVTEETADTVRIDFNHPFAGKTLEYRIELVEVR